MATSLSWDDVKKRSGDFVDLEKVAACCACLPTRYAPCIQCANAAQNEVTKTTVSEWKTATKSLLVLS